MCRKSYFALAATTTALAALVLVLPVQPVHASLYELDLRAYDGSNLICGQSLDFQSDAAPVTGLATDAVADVVSNSSTEYEAIAGLGYVGMKQRVSHRVNPGWNRVFGTCSEVRTVIDDFQVVGPPGQITASLNANLLANIETDTLSARTQLRVTVSLRLTEDGPSVSNTVDLDFLESRDIDQVINSGPLTFNVGDVLEAELKIEMRIVTFGTTDGLTMSHDFDFLDQDLGFGLHFSETEVLTLPAGYTVNSEDGGVGGNVWGGTVPVASSTWGAVKSMYR